LLWSRPPSKGGFRAASASPPCVMRRPNGRCSLSGSVWPSPDSTSSRLQISDAVRIRQRQLLRETLGCTPFRRKERVFLLQRLRPEICRLPFRRTRDSLFKPRTKLVAEILVLRQQLNVLRRQVSKRPQLSNTDRFLFVWLYRWFPS